MKPSISRLHAGAAALGLLALAGLAGCTYPDRADIYAAECKPREIRKAGMDGNLSGALALQAAENRVYRDCLERRAVRVAP